jgi:hypothetical protein
MQIEKILNYEYLKSITRDLGELINIVTWLEEHKLLDNDCKLYYNSNGALPNTLFKKAERCIRENRHQISQYRAPQSINYIIKLIEHDQKIRNQAFSIIDDILKEQFKIINCQKDIKSLENSTTKEIFYLEKEDNKYIILYFSILGKIHLPENIPIDCVKTQLLGEEVFSAILGEEKVALSVYPTLRDLNNSSKIKNNLVIQKFLNNYNSLETIIKHKVTREKGVEIYGKILADIQKTAYGIYKMSKDINFRNRSLESLNDYKDYVYLSDSNSFYIWMTKNSWISRKLNPSNYNNREVHNNEIDLNYEFLKLAKRSEMRITNGGCISQLDLLPRNMLISQYGSFNYKLCDFEFVSYSDPAYDLGMAIYCIWIQSIRDEYVDETKKLIELFLSSYIENFKIIKNEFNLSIDINEFYADAFKYGGFLLYGVTQSDYRNRYEKYLDLAKTISLCYITDKFTI